MKYLISFFLLTPILIFSQITEDISRDTPSVVKKLYTKGSFMYGPGTEEVWVATKYYQDSDKDPEDIYMRPGGGFGIEAVIGYDVTRFLSFELALGWLTSGEVIDKDNMAILEKFPLQAIILYRIPINKKFTPYIGGGLATLLSIKYTEKVQGTESDVIYSKPIGFTILGGTEFKKSQSPWYWFGELRYNILGEYTVKEATMGGRTVTGIIQGSSLDNLNANGVFIVFGVGYYLK